MVAVDGSSEHYLPRPALLFRPSRIVFAEGRHRLPVESGLRSARAAVGCWRFLGMRVARFSIGFARPRPATAWRSACARARTPTYRPARAVSPGDGPRQSSRGNWDCSMDKAVLRRVFCNRRMQQCPSGTTVLSGNVGTTGRIVPFGSPAGGRNGFSGLSRLLGDRSCRTWRPRVG